MKHSINLIGVPLLFTRLTFGLLLLHGHGSFAAQVESLSPVERFIMFATNCPPLHNAIFEWKPNAKAEAVFFQFRYEPSSEVYEWGAKSKLPPPSYRFLFKPSAFLARKYTSLTDLDAPFSTEEKAVGVWKDQYWFLEPHSDRRSELHRYNYASEDWGNALAGYAEMMFHFSLFTTFGISEFGQGSVVAGESSPLVLIQNSKRYPISLRIVDGVPVTAFFRREAANPVEYNLTINFRYDTNIAPLGIPVGWAWENGTSGKLLKLELGDASKPLAKNVFIPEQVFTNRSVFHLIRTNKHDYILENGKMTRMDDPVVALAALQGRPQNRKYYLGTLVAFSLLLAPLIWVLGKKEKKNQKPKNI